MKNAVALLAALLAVLASCKDSGSPTSSTPPPEAPAGPVQTTVAIHRATFQNMDADEGSFTEFTLPVAGTLRVSTNWTFPADDINIYFTYHGCPNVRAALNGGCVILAENKSGAKPAELALEITAHDLTVDPAKPGARLLFVHNKGPSRESGTVQVTMTTTGTPPTANETPVAMPDPTSAGTSGTPPSPTPSGATCNGESVPASVGCGVPTAKCNDGTWSCSQNRSGTCSSHGGVACWVCPGVLCLQSSGGLRFGQFELGDVRN